MESTLVMIKPDHYEFADEIILQLDFNAIRSKIGRVDSIPREVIQEHYLPHKGKSFYDYMTEYFVGKPTVVAVYVGNDIVDRMRRMIGVTDPSKAGEEKIRGKYSNDSLELATFERRPVKNVIHASESLEEALREIKVWEKFLNQ